MVYGGVTVCSRLLQLGPQELCLSTVQAITVREPIKEQTEFNNSYMCMSCMSKFLIRMHGDMVKCTPNKDMYVTILLLFVGAYSVIAFASRYGSSEFWLPSNYKPALVVIGSIVVYSMQGREHPN